MYLGAPVAQLDRASAFEAECRRFESCRARQCQKQIQKPRNKHKGWPSISAAGAQPLNDYHQTKKPEQACSGFKVLLYIIFISIGFLVFCLA